MRNLIRAFIRHPVAPNLAMIVMIMAGVFATAQLTRQLLPSFALNLITIEVIWQGASATDVEALIAQPLEDELLAVDDLRSIQSTSRDGLARLTLERDSLKRTLASLLQTYTPLHRDSKRVAGEIQASDQLIEDRQRELERLKGLAESLGKLDRYAEMANTLRTLIRVDASAAAYERLGFAEIDHDRARRCGFPEVIYGAGKTPEEVAAIAERLWARGDRLLCTRAEPAAFDAVRRVVPEARYHERARAIHARRGDEPPGDGLVAIVAAGTADLPVAEEARLTARLMDGPTASASSMMMRYLSTTVSPNSSCRNLSSSLK